MISGELIPLEEVADETFAQKFLGDGIAIIPDADEEVTAPSDGTITAASEDMSHAIGMKLTNGVEILIHIGINTVAMKGDGFELLVKTDDKVTAGTPLVRFSAAKIRDAGYNNTIMMILTDTGGVEPTELIKTGSALKNETDVIQF
jgi:PTS system trehalose-specific IIC component